LKIDKKTLKGVMSENPCMRTWR